MGAQGVMTRDSSRGGNCCSPCSQQSNVVRWSVTRACGVASVGGQDRAGHAPREITSDGASYHQTAYRVSGFGH